MKRINYFACVCALLFASSTVSAQMLVEAFRNIDCANCKTPDGQYEAYLATKPQYKVQIVYLHNNFPAPNDPFYLAANHDIDYRSGTFYSVQADPDVFVSGIAAGSSFSNWKTLTDQAAATITYPVTMTLKASTGVAGLIAVDIHLEGSTGGKLVKPYAMIVESGITYNNVDSYGNPSSGTWDNIFRAMMPQKDGGDAIAVSGPTDLHYTFDPTGKKWVITNCKIVAFLQEVTAQTDNISRKVDGFSTAPIVFAAVGMNDGSSSASLHAPVPNPSVASAQLAFHLASSQKVSIVVYDELGREVETIYNAVADGDALATFTPRNLARGIYYARMYAGGDFVGMQKIVFAP